MRRDHDAWAKEVGFRRDTAVFERWSDQFGRDPTGWFRATRLRLRPQPFSLRLTNCMLLSPLLDGGHLFLEAFLEPLVRGVVVAAVFEAIRQALHLGQLFRGVMGVLIAFAVTLVGHKAGDGIAQMERDRI